MPLPKDAAHAYPYADDAIISLRPTPSASISVGDPLVFDGQTVIPSAAVGNLTSVKAYMSKFAGIAMEASPVSDKHGRSIYPDTIAVARRGVFEVSGVQGGTPALGLFVFPHNTGVSAFAATGVAGQPAVWQTAGAAVSAGLGQLIGVRGSGLWTITLDRPLNV